MGPVAAGLADMKLAAREIVEARQRRRARSGDDHLLDAAQTRRGEVDDLLALGRDGEVGCDDIPQSRV